MTNKIVSDVVDHKENNRATTGLLCTLLGIILVCPSHMLNGWTVHNLLDGQTVVLVLAAWGLWVLDTQDKWEAYDI